MMGRWDFLDSDFHRDAERGQSIEGTKKERVSTDVSVGRGPTDGSGPSLPERNERILEQPAERSPEQRIQYRIEERSYSLRSSEIAAMTDLGKFRTIDVQDLARFVYGGNEKRLNCDLKKLRSQGLIQEKTLFRAHKTPRKLLTLTAIGKQILGKTSDLPMEQRIYHGFVKQKELDHDADLYKVYQNAADEIREKGGRPTRVRLDFEMRGSIKRAKGTARPQAGDERERFLEAVAEDHGLTIRGKSIYLPDIQIEYQTREGTVERQNLELVSCNYREAGIRGKAAAGFKLYVRSGDAGRVRRALHDTGMVREVLSV